jgi:tetratricopeptide (TPR) repeat protein
MTLTRPRLLTLLTPAVLFGALLLALLALNGPGSPEPPAGADIGRSSGDPLRDAQAAVRAVPDSAAAYAALGDAYLQRARDTGDPSFYSRAERAFGAARRRDPRDVDALVGAGTLAGLRHDFAGQLRLGREARRAAPGLARPYTIVADAQLELGRYDAAARSIQRLVDLKPGIAAYARASYFRELTGDPAGALAAMRLATSAGGTAENVAYVQTLVGDLELGRGRARAAREAYRAALRARPSYPQALTGLARVDAASGRLARAASRLRRSTDLLPLPGALTLLAGVERAAGRDATAAGHLATARAQHRLYRSAGAAPDADAVLFEADHGSAARAVRLARATRRAAPGIRSADALGWALTRAGRPRAGLRWAGRALALGSRDPLFRFHAGMAARAAGRSGARDLAIALRGAAMLTPSQAAAAREALR